MEAIASGRGIARCAGELAGDENHFHTRRAGDEQAQQADSLLRTYASYADR